MEEVPMHNTNSSLTLTRTLSGLECHSKMKMSPWSGALQLHWLWSLSVLYHVLESNRNQGEINTAEIKKNIINWLSWLHSCVWDSRAYYFHSRKTLLFWLVVFGARLAASWTKGYQCAKKGQHCMWSWLKMHSVLQCSARIPHDWVWGWATVTRRGRANES